MRRSQRIAGAMLGAARTGAVLCAVALVSAGCHTPTPEEGWVQIGTRRGDGAAAPLKAARPVRVESAPSSFGYDVNVFSGRGLWSIDSANNYGVVSASTNAAFAGVDALRLDFRASGRGNTIFRKEVELDLTGVRELRLDVDNGSDSAGIACALAFQVEGGILYETVPVELAPGLNRDVAFALHGKGMRDGTDLTAWADRCRRIKRLMILVYPGENRTGTLTVGRLRADRPGVNRAPPPRLAATEPLTVERMPAGAVQELRLAFEPSSIRTIVRGTNGTERAAWAPVPVSVRLTQPNGRIMSVEGFLKATPDETGGAGRPDAVIYAARFAPDKPGLWHITAGYWSERQWLTAFEQDVTVVPAPAALPRIRVDGRDKSCFATTSGAAFYPIGENVCWSGDYEPYLNAMRDHGGNLVRVWICPWNFPLLADDAATIRLESAAELDRVLALAAGRGIYVQLVLTYHGWFKDDWNRNPFNASLGGPCARAGEFWYNNDARRLFKAYLDYVVHRWAAFPNIFAWELVNEADLAAYDMETDVLAWHKEMGEYVKRIDPYKHLVSTSVAGKGAMADIWQLPCMDFCASHIYAKNLHDAIPDAWRLFAAAGKPWFITEIGRGCGPADDQIDPEGRHLHHALWLAWMTPGAGNCLPWWWDTFIEPNGLYRHFDPIAAFSRDEDRRGQGLRLWRANRKEDNGATVRAQGIVGNAAVYGFVFAPERFESVGPLPDKPLLQRPWPLQFDRLPDGVYDCEIWDTYAGKPLTRQPLACRDGRLVIVVPTADTDLAFKVKARR